jgi:hypothetical protein
VLVALSGVVVAFAVGVGLRASGHDGHGRPGPGVLEVPLYGVIGGLHLPVHPWPRHLPQALTGAPRPPWQPLSDRDIDQAVTRLRTAGASLLAVSGHDSTPYTMRRFPAAFGPGFRQV